MASNGVFPNDLAATSSIVTRIQQFLANREGPMLVALDGFSGAGKSMLARAVAAQTDAAVVAVDDFYNGGTLAEWDSRTPEENADLCIQWRRLRAEALEPLLKGETAGWRPFNWKTGEGVANRLIKREPRRIVILDGAYSCRRELSDLADLCILVDVPVDVRWQRLTKREGAMGHWFARWDAAERYYFTNVRLTSSFDLVVTNPDCRRGAD